MESQSDEHKFRNRSFPERNAGSNNFNLVRRRTRTRERVYRILLYIDSLFSESMPFVASLTVGRFIVLMKQLHGVPEIILFAIDLPSMTNLHNINN